VTVLYDLKPKIIGRCEEIRRLSMIRFTLHEVVAHDGGLPDPVL
jgi:hypothetical protein